MILPEHITTGFDFAEAIEMAELCHRARQLFAPGRSSPSALYNSLFADEWSFAHTIGGDRATARVLIVRRANRNQWAIVFHGGTIAGRATDAVGDPGGDEASDGAQAIPITNLDSDEAGTDEIKIHEPARSAAYPPLPGEVAPPPLGARVAVEWLRAIDACKGEIERFFSTVVSSNNEQARSFHPNELEIYLTGHGAGGCLAALCALYLKRKWESQIDFPYFSLKMVNFGSPKIGNQAFADYYSGQMKSFSYRVQNLLDGATYEPVLAAPFPYNLQLLLPGVDYVRNGDEYHMAYAHIGEAFILAGVGSPKLEFNFRGPFKPVLMPFSHGPDGYKQMLVAAQQLQDTYWRPLQQVAAKVDTQYKELISVFQQAKRAATHQHKR